MECADCKKELNESETTTYVLIDNLGLIQDYASILCKECIIKRKGKIASIIKETRTNLNP
jgi:DNA-directed RNA polymerase subunit RPC12/RpoP